MRIRNLTDGGRTLHYFSVCPAANRRVRCAVALFIILTGSVDAVGPRFKVGYVRVEYSYTCKSASTVRQFRGQGILGTGTSTRLRGYEAKQQD
jgi:hypothetical protein